MKLYEFIESERKKLTDFRNHRIEYQATRPNRGVYDLEEDEWISIYMAYLAKESLR